MNADRKKIRATATAYRGYWKLTRVRRLVYATSKQKDSRVRMKELKAAHARFRRSPGYEYARLLFEFTSTVYPSLPRSSTAKRPRLILLPQILLNLMNRPYVLRHCTEHFRYGEVNALPNRASLPDTTILYNNSRRLYDVITAQSSIVRPLLKESCDAYFAIEDFTETLFKHIESYS